MSAIKKAKQKYTELCDKAKGRLLKSVELDYIDVVYSYYKLPISDYANKTYPNVNAAVLKIKRFQDVVSVERFYSHIDPNSEYNTKYESFKYRSDYWEKFSFNNFNK